MQITEQVKGADFNVNLQDPSCAMGGRHKSLFLCYDLLNLFTEPTRVTSTTETCIDNIFTNMKPCSKHVINRLGSDHIGQLAVFSMSIAKACERKINKYQ